MCEQLFDYHTMFIPAYPYKMDAFAYWPRKAIAACLSNASERAYPMRQMRRGLKIIGMDMYFISADDAPVLAEYVAQKRPESYFF